MSVQVREAEKQNKINLWERAKTSAVSKSTIWFILIKNEYSGLFQQHRNAWRPKGDNCSEWWQNYFHGLERQLHNIEQWQQQAREVFMNGNMEDLKKGPNTGKSQWECIKTAVMPKQLMHFFVFTNSLS